VNRSEADPPGLPRRRALQLLATGAATGLLGACTGGSHPASGPSPTTPAGTGSSTSAAVTPPTAADWAALAAGLEGSLVQPGGSGFAAAHQLYDPRWDSVTPAAVVRAAGAADVAEAVQFARRHGVRLTPRGGGHSYLGASSVSGGLVVDTRAMRSVTYDAATGSTTIGAGAQLIDVYTALATHGRGLPGGTCPTVGLAGLAQGGGFGVFDRAYGLTCDGVVEMSVVTADGVAKIVDSKHDPDLFWALRGGGGGDFAIVTSLRSTTFAAGEVGRWSARWTFPHAATVVAGWQQFIRTASDDSWANLHLDVVPGSAPAVVVIGIALRGRSPQADLDRLVAHVGRTPSSTSASVHSHLATVLSLAGCSDGASCHLPPAGTFARESFVAGSSVPRSWLSSAGIDRLVAAVSDGGPWSGERHAICDPLGGAVARVSSTATAFAWRQAPFTVQWYAKLPLRHPPGDVAAAGRWVAAARARTAPDGGGAYVNYPSADVQDPATYHGAQYARLQQVKAAYDPMGWLRPPGGVSG
jgi:FAD/FMN-containing dehydrogenase